MKTKFKQQVKKIMKGAISLFAIMFLSSGMTHAQQKTTMNVKDLDSHIENYVEKNYKDFKIVEAYKYDLVYEMVVKKGNEAQRLVFDSKGKFLYKKTDADKAKFATQTRSTMSSKDVGGDIEKYIKKNYEGYNLTEAFKYDEVYTTKITKGADSEMLIFDKDGKFVMKQVAAKPAAQPVKADTAHKADTTHKEPAVKPDTTHKEPAAKPDTTKK